MENYKKNLKFHISCLSKKRSEIDETAHSKKYIVWENKSNICWLDASMALIAHNKVMKRASLVCPTSKISYIIVNYADAISMINSEKKCFQWLELLNLAKAKLNCVQDTTLQYLSPILKYKPGDPDSAFCSLYNLLKQDPVIKSMFDVTWISVKTCTNCAYHSESTKTKPIITLSKISSFDPKSPAVLYNCKCDRSEQKIQFVLVTLPPCLIFHFENGAGHEKPPLSFVIQEREYHLTCIMTLEKGQESNINHFISWVRDPFADKWLDCNDLNPDIIYFTPNFPDIRFEDVSFYVYESFDDRATISGYKVVNIKKSDEVIPCIDISEEPASESGNSVNNATKIDLLKKQEVKSTESQDETLSTDMDLSKFKKEIEELISDENIIQSNLVKSSETSCIKMKDAENDKNETKLIEKTSPDQGSDIQNEEMTIDNGFQDLKVSDVKSGNDVSEIVSQADYDGKNSFDVCKLDDPINTCFNQKQSDEKDKVSPYEEEKLEEIAAVEEKTDIDVKDDEKNNILMPAEDLHISDLQEKKSEDITKDESGTSYVKVSFCKNKYPGLVFSRQNSATRDKNPISDDAETTSIRKSPKSVKDTKTSKRNRDEEWETKPQKRPRKNQRFEQTLEEARLTVIEEEITHSVHKKVPHPTSKDNISSEDQVNLNKNNNRDAKVLEDYVNENVWGSHEPNCNCEFSTLNPITLDQTINTVVDYTFGYLCKLSREFKKANSQ